MTLKKNKLRLAALALTLVLCACGGGNADEQLPDEQAAAQNQPQSAELLSQAARATPRPSAPASVGLQSDPGDYIGGGNSYQYTQANSLLAITYTSGVIQVSVHGNESWNGTFVIPRAPAKLKPVRVKVAPRGTMSWFGDGRGCNTSTGSFSLSNVVYLGTTLKSFDLAFDQHCEGATPALHGLVHFNADDNTSPPGPAPIPAGLWSPPANVIPQSGRSIYLESQAGDYIGAGQTYLYTQANATLSMNASSAHAGFSVNGNEWWNGDFQAMLGLTQLQPGYYANLQRYPFNNPATGGLDWSGQGRGCNTLTGWFVVDDVSYTNGALSSIRLRFEQHCDGASAALHGQIVWTATDSTTPGGPTYPPSGLWSPPQGAVPDTARSVYLESDAGDYIGAGQNYLYTQANANLAMTSDTGHVQIRVNGDTWWTGDFKAMSSLTQLEPGYYANLKRYPFNDPAIGGLNWSGAGRGCNTLTGWFVVDSVSYSNGALTSIKLRFEQHCEGASAALHGQIIWTATDLTAPPGPAVDPGNLWSADPAALPASGNYVYLNSDAGDYIGGGHAYLYTTGFTMGTTASHLSFSKFAIGDFWSGDFTGPSTQTQVLPGYYANLERYPFNNPALGGLSWYGNGRGCNTLTGWFVIDNVTYVSGVLKSVDLRFEQHCEGGSAALHGQIHWAVP